MKKAYTKILCLILSAVITIGIMPAVELKTAAASQVYTSEDGQWQYEKSSTTIEFYKSDNSKWNGESILLTRYIGSDTNVTIPENLDNYRVIGIGDYCFSGVQQSETDIANLAAINSIEHIEIPSEIYKIGKAAFSNMESLRSFIFSDNAPLFKDPVVLGDYMFSNSNQLSELEIPATREYSISKSFLLASEIHTLRTPSYYIANNLNNSYLYHVEHLILTDIYGFDLENPDPFDCLSGLCLKTVEFLGDSPVRGKLSDYLDYYGKYYPTRFPTLIFHHIPSVILERNLIQSGYIRNYDEETQITSFSLNYTPDNTYTTVQPEIIAGEFGYSLTDNGDAIITGYYGENSEVEFPALIHGHRVIAIGDGTGPLNFSNIGKNLVSAEIPEGIEKIGFAAFYNLQWLEEILLPTSLKYIDGAAFYNCRRLKTAALPNLIYLGSDAFVNCYLTNISIPGSLKTVPPFAFAKTGIRPSLHSIILCEGVESVDCSAFTVTTSNYFGSDLNVQLPSTLHYIGESSFESVGISGDLVIPAGVEVIGEAAFCNNPFMRSIVLPDDIGHICAFAFADCTVTEPLIIPDSVFHIESHAFENLHVPTVHLPAQLKAYPDSLFFGLHADWLQIPDGVVDLRKAFSEAWIGDLTIPNSVLKMDRAFDGLVADRVSFGIMPIIQANKPFYSAYIGDLTFTEGTNYISNDIFSGASIYGKVILDNISVVSARAFYGQNLSELEVSSGVTQIGWAAFATCRSLEKVWWNAVDCTTAKGAFANCPALTDFIIGENVNTIPTGIFSNTGELSGQITLPDSVTVLEDGAFAGTEITEITLPANLQYIGENCFANCKQLRSVVIPDSVTVLGNSAFNGCTALNAVTLPNSLTMIGEDTFRGCMSLQTITLPNAVSTIGSGAFADCTALTEITIPSSVITLSTDAFNGCSALARVDYLPLNCTVSGSGSPFANCPALEYFHFNSSIKCIPDNLLKDCSALEAITLPESITDIGVSTFSGSGLNAIIIPASVESIDDACFADCKALNSVTIEGNLLLLGKGTFSGCDQLTNLVIPDTVRDIGNDCFSNCTSLETVYMSRNVVYIPNRCFENCTALTSFTWEADSKLIGKLAFAGCTSLTSFNFVGIEKLYPNSFKGSGIGVASLGEAQDEAAAALEIVEAQSFMNCPKLQTVALGGNVSTVQTKAFANCENLETAIISDCVETIAHDAFENCPKLTIYCSEDSYAYNYAVENDIPVSTFVVEPIPNQRYTGKDIEPPVSVSVSGAPLSKGVDFKVRYSDNVNAGTASVKVSGINTYKMFASNVSFVILTRDISEAEIKDIDEQKYTGSAVTPKVRVTYNGKALREGTDYNVVYSNNTSVGTAKATLTGIGNFSGTAKTEFSIVESGSPITPPWHGHDEDPEEPETPPGNPSQPDNPSEPGDTPGDDSGDNGSYIMRVLSWFTDTLIPFVFRMLSAVISLLTRA